jgi:hypothetical protein
MENILSQLNKAIPPDSPAAYRPDFDENTARREAAKELITAATTLHQWALNWVPHCKKFHAHVSSWLYCTLKVSALIQSIF